MKFLRSKRRTSQPGQPISQDRETGVVSKKENGSAKPFLRWVGGKSLFVAEILTYLPNRLQIGTYFEPFLGAGSVFLALGHKCAKLSDLNFQLIETYRAIESNPDLVSRYLKELGERDSEDFYYRVRDVYNNSPSSVKQAARFIYLNKACFNGIFRVNTNGDFNVPYGFKKQLALPSLKDLRRISSLLKGVELITDDYENAVSSARKHDLVYLDPPYPPINGSSFFTHYTKERFSTDDQADVANVAEELDRKGCFVVITNADTPAIRSLYRHWYIKQIERTRWVTSSKHKHKVNELIISNFKITRRK
jgi:DNA adenine methylase